MRHFLLIGLLSLFVACAQEQSYSSKDTSPAEQESPVVNEDSSLGSLSVESSTPDPVPTVAPSETFPQVATLVAGDQDAQINLAAEPSVQADSEGYGLVGDKVTVSASAQGDNGSKWYQAKFEASGAEGWIESRFVEIGNIGSSSETTQTSSLESKANSANLSVPQVKELISIDKNNPRGIDVKIVLPTYVPAGYSVKELLIEAEGSIAAPSYDIVYANDLGNCFEISAASGGFGAGAEDFEIITVESKALGTVDVGYTQFDNVDNEPRIGLNQFSVDGVIPSDQQYTFWSPASSRLYGECDAIELQEAAKIVESLDYLNP